MSTPFRQLEPPPGGLVKLRAGLEAQRRRMVRKRLAAVVLASCVCVLAGMWLFSEAPSTPRVMPTRATMDWAALHPAVSLAEVSAHPGASVQMNATSQVGVVRVARERGVSYYRVSALPAMGQNAP